MTRYHLAGIEPEPWTAPEGTIGRRGGKLFVQFHKNAQVAAFQNAVKEEFPVQNPHPTVEDEWIKLTFWLWRSTGGARKRVDATNCQKALEDALQGILYTNDRLVRDVRTVIVEQTEGIMPHIVIDIEPWSENDAFPLPEYVEPSISDNTWMPGDF